jgi:hypothetical protein
MGLMTSAPSVLPAGAPEGCQRPRVLSVPPFESSEVGREAVELAARAGLVLDPWQRFVLEQALGERGNRWAAFEVGLVVPRQNGKGALLEARELAGLFLLDEELILHSAHEFKTASEAFRRVSRLIEDNPEFDRRVSRVRTANGSEMIELKNGQRLRFVARSKGSGRGFSGDCVILDEAYNLGDEAMSALLPTLSARPNPQVWYTSSAGDETSVQLGRVRARGVDGDDPSLAYFEWSVDDADYDDADPAAWAIANPGLGIRIDVDYIARERAALSPPSFARERLGVGSWPMDLADAWAVVRRDVWAGLVDRKSRLRDPVAFAADVTPSRSFGAIATAGRNEAGLRHVEIVDHRPGTAWMVERIVELAERWDPCAVVVDAAGAAGSLISELELAGVLVLSPQSREVAQGCGQLFDAAVDAGDVRHLDQSPLNAALAGAQKRPLGDAWAWDRKLQTVDLCPLVAATLALWGFTTRGDEGMTPAEVGVWMV